MKQVTLIPLLFFCAAPLAAQTIPATINYQGRLTDNSPAQTPVNSTVQMQFAIYDAASGGTRLWQEPAADNTGTGIAITTGIFNVVLGSTAAIPATVFTGANSTRYLQITLNPAGSAEILSPRQLVTATGYANLAQNANNAVSATSATTVTNGVYTTGSYADPAWLTSLSGTKISGAVTNSSQLGGVAAAGWQRALATPACGANQYLTTVNPDGSSVCAPASVTETDPKVGTLTTGRVPRWNGSTLADGAIYDTGTQLGIGTTSPITQLHVSRGTPVAVGSVATGTSPFSVYVQGRYAFTANAVANMLQVFDVSNPAAPVAVGSVATGANPHSVYVQGRYAYTANYTAGTLQVFDVSNPAAPVAVGSVATGALPNSVYVQGRYAYTANISANTLQVFDVSNPAAPVAVGSVATGAGPYSVYVQGRYAYTANVNASTLQVLDVSNPAAPVAVGSVATGAGPCSVYVQGRYAYTANNTANTLQVFDVSNPAAPVAVGSVAAGSGPNSVYVQGRYAFTANAVANTLQVFDVSNPAVPVAVGSVATGANPRIVYVQGRYAYTVNYIANTLQVFDLGGAYVQQLEAGGIETGTLATRGNVQINGDAQIKGGLTVGTSALVTGNVAVQGMIKAGNYLQLVTITGAAPLAADCNTAAQAGRMIARTDGVINLYICTGVTGWIGK